MSALDRLFREETLPTPHSGPLSREDCLAGLRAARELADSAVWDAERRGWNEMADRWQDRLNRLAA